MLEPSAIHSYEPPVYRTNPPSPLEGRPPSLTFGVVVLESADAQGGPSPALLHHLREQGCKLILAQLAEDAEEDLGMNIGRPPSVESPPHSRRGTSSTPKAYRPTSLNKEWYDAVFDKVLSLTGEEGSGNSPLERFFADEGMQSWQAVCFACTEAGSKAFSAVDVGLVLAPTHDKVWRRIAEEDVPRLALAGADCALSQSPTSRQLCWLHEVFTQKLWCCCMWLAPAPEELKNQLGVPPDLPSAQDRAELTAVASGCLAALGHPPWASRSSSDEGTFPCTALLGDEMLPCPDWTLLEPRFKGRSYPLRTLHSFPKVSLYCHSLDVGLAKVNHTVEAEDRDGLVVRVSSQRLVSICREGTASTEMSVTIMECGSKKPDICIRSGLACSHLPPGFRISGRPHVDWGKAVLTAAYENEQTNERLVVKAWHRLCADDGRGDIELPMHEHGDSALDRAQRATHAWGMPRKDACEVDLIFQNPRKGTRYTVEKVVTVTAGGGPKVPSTDVSFPTRTDSADFSHADLEKESDELLTAPEIEEEHASAWRDYWDGADIELAGTRKAARTQRAVRLFRFHQLCRGESVGNGKKKPVVPECVSGLFRDLLGELSFDEQACDRPSNILTSRIAVLDPRGPVLRIEPKVPPDCHRIRFNAALGGRWHRFTVTPGTVQILVQGPISVQQGRRSEAKAIKKPVQLHDVEQPPKFIILASDGADGVEVRAMPWHEVQVQHALTDLGRPDGSTGGFYGLMRRTRFIKLEVLRRLFTDGDELAAQGSYCDETLTQPLCNALASLKSAPRPPGWRQGQDSNDLHILDADATMRTRVLFAYEKNELSRDILFLRGRFTEHKESWHVGATDGGDFEVKDPMMTIKEAKEMCSTLPGCAGFCFQGSLSGIPADSKVKIHFQREGKEVVPQPGWTSVSFEAGEPALAQLLEEQHQERFCGPDALVKAHWVEDEVPDFKLAVARCLDCLEQASLRKPEVTPNSRQHSESSLVGGKNEGLKKPFRNFITDRDGTTNNYCDRYASSVQSAYNAAWLSHFARHCVENAVFITAAPLGGRPSAEGLMELCVAPRGLFTYTGSKGREYFSDATQQLLEAEQLPKQQRELVEELHRRILALCQQPGNTKFLGIGSGLQRKFGEVTMARNDPASTVPEPESRRFMAAVRRVKEELDPDGTGLDLHDTGTDMEIFPRVNGSRPSFDKGHGVLRLDSKLGLQVNEGPNIVCGDTGSDLPMIIAALRLMCGDKMVDRWQERMRKEEEAANPEVEALDDTSSYRVADDDALEEEDEEAKQQKAEQEQEEEREAREKAGRLAVLFVVSPEANAKNPKLAEQVKAWCDIAGVHYAILPSPDVLVYSLARFAESVSHRRVTDPQVLLANGHQDSGVESEAFPEARQKNHWDVDDPVELGVRECGILRARTETSLQTNGRRAAGAGTPTQAQAGEREDLNYL